MADFALDVHGCSTQVLQSEMLITQNYTKALQDVVDVMPIVRHLYAEGILNQLEMEQLISLEGSQCDNVDCLARILAEKGASMVTIIKQKIRRFKKSQELEHGSTDSKGIPERGMLSKSAPSQHMEQSQLGLEYAERGLEYHRKAVRHAGTGRKSENGKSTLTPEMETFSVLFYTFAVKCVHMMTSSLGTFKKPKWLNVDVAIEDFPKFFPERSLSDIHDVTDELIKVSLVTLLDSFQQLHYKHRHVLQENKLLKEGKGTKQSSPHKKGHHHTPPDHGHGECRREIAKLKKELVVLAQEKQQTVDITQQWSIQCHELEKQIEELTSQLGAYHQSGGGTQNTNCTTRMSRNSRPILKARDSASDEESEEMVHSSDTKEKLEFEVGTLQRKLSKAKSRISTLEKKLQESVANSSYFKVLQEKTDAENLLEQSTRKVEELSEMVQALTSEQKELQTTNEALLEDMRALKNEGEEDKNYIEELKDQIGNYKLNARLKEPSVREMSRQLQTNRDLEEKVKEQQCVLDAAKEEKIQALGRIRQLELDIRKHLERRSLLEKQLLEAKDELIAFKTHVRAMEVKSGVSQRSSALDCRTSTKLGTDTNPQDPGRLSDHQTKDGLLFNGHAGHGNKEVFAPLPTLSFRSQERKCPVCEQVFLKLTQHEFTAHVAGCFK